MDIEVLAAMLFALLSLGVVGFQLALALGAPWGSYAMGGAYPGAYPPRMRVVAAVQAVVIAFIGVLVLSNAGVLAAAWGQTPDFVLWIIIGLLCVGLVLNLITPSAGERRIWAPTVAVMLGCCVAIALL